ncbi:MAG: aconitate hydratase AcnA [Puniceicoccales bacterium]|nr:aconitate hydratase AcnA [Puniceicoccales bacterium]
MSARANPFQTLRPLGETGAAFYSLPALHEAGFAKIPRLPQSIRLVLESLLRNCDGEKVTEADIRNLAEWDATAPGSYEVPFMVARVILQDFTGVPLLADLAAMRSAAVRLGKDPKIIEPLVPVDLVVDHSVQVDAAGCADALGQNLAFEFSRNRERYQFLKWGTSAFDTFRVVPPGIGIVHQVNLEYLAKGVFVRDGVALPDTLVGTDSHTTMINGLGIVGWGVGGIEAEAAMLGQPVTFLVPEVVGVRLGGAPCPGVTATDIVLRVTELLRRTKVVGKFVEFYGPGAAALSVPDRATLANMAPEYGATTGFFGVDATTIAYLRDTGRDAAQCALAEEYFKAQQLWGIPDADGSGAGVPEYSQTVELDLATVRPAVAGPRRPQDRVELDSLKTSWRETLVSLLGAAHARDARPVPVVLADGPKAGTTDTVGHGSVLIAAITSCTNTSNPSVMLAAGLLAQKANALGLRVRPAVKTSLGPGSRVVTAYLEKTGLQAELDKLGFQTVGYGCTTCIGNSGPLDSAIEHAVREHGLAAASALSGNRNFEARVHQSIKANFLMSPPLVVAFALAGTVDIDLENEPLGKDADGAPVFLRDIWPSDAEVAEALRGALSPALFRELYSDFAGKNPRWNEIPAPDGLAYAWDDASTYIQEPPFFGDTAPARIADITGARPLGVFGDSVTTDHISPAGAIKTGSPAGHYLAEHGVAPADFNSYGSRRGNDRVMTRGTFANVRIKNLMLPGVEGGLTRCFADDATGPVEAIFDAAEKYRAKGVPLLVIGGEDYGMGSSRDWAAKGTRLLGVKAVLAKSFERIHRSNLAGMGVLPLTFKHKADYDSVKALANVTYDVLGLSDAIRPGQDAVLRVRAGISNARPPFDIPVIVRLDTPVEIAYYRAGGILPYVLDLVLGRAPAA